MDKIDQISSHPDGPDYSSGTLIHLPGSEVAVPFQVGMDLYPMKDAYDNLDKQDIYDLHPLPSNPQEQDDNKHQILLHINLFFKKPSNLGGNRLGDELR